MLFEYSFVFVIFGDIKMLREIAFAARRFRLFLHATHFNPAWSVCLPVVCHLHIRAPCLNRLTDLDEIRAKNFNTSQSYVRAI